MKKSKNGYGCCSSLVKIKEKPMCWIAALVLLWGIATTAADEKPNLVLLLTDDHPYDAYGFMGDRIAETPHLDRLAEAGMTFTRGYVTAPVCRPSLATVLTGLYPHQSGIVFNKHPWHFSPIYPYQKLSEGIPDDPTNGAHLIHQIQTLPQLLRRAGYASLQTGKHWEGDFSEGGFDEGTTHYLPDGQRISFNGTLRGGSMIGRDTLEPIYDFVNRQAASDTPFFVWYGVFLPHAPVNAPGKYLRLYADQQGLSDVEKRYYANISWLDDSIGELLDFFEQKGLLDNTLFILVSDNGITLKDKASPFWGIEKGKTSVFEPGIRSPIVIRWDGVVEPGRCELPVSSIDIVPTFLEAAGVDYADARLPGRDLIEVGKNCDAAAAEPVFGEVYNPNVNVLDIPERLVSYRFVVDGDWKLIRPENLDRREVLHEYWPKEAYRDSDHFEEIRLYNVAEDPEETRNLAEDPGQADRVKRMMAMLHAWWPLDADKTARRTLERDQLVLEVGAEQAVLVEENFDWGEGIPARGKLFAGDPLAGLRPMYGQGEWMRLRSQPSVFAGYPGPGNGRLRMEGGNNIVQIPFRIKDKVNAVVDFDWSSPGKSFDIGFQQIEPSFNLLATQQEKPDNSGDFLRAGLKSDGRLILACQVVEKKVEAESSGSLRPSGQVTLELKINRAEGTATLTARTAAGSVETAIRWNPEAVPDWQAFTINQHGGGVAEIDSVTVSSKA
jgi:uncharacterized sulfatase